MPSGGPFEHAYVDAAGLRLRVGRHGSGPPLLLITGIGAHLDMWAPFARHAGERELIAFDPPGAGLSQRPRRPLRMRGLARVVAALLDALGLERVDVLGYSFGGGLAQELAHRAPERVRRLVLCATGPGLGGVPPKPMAALMLATPARYYHPRLLELSLAHIAGGRTRARAGRAGRARGGAPAASALAARLRLPAVRGRRLVEPAVAAPDIAADAGRRGRGRPERAAAATAGCSPRASRTAACTSSRGAATSSCSTSPRASRGPIRAFLDAA